MDFFHSTPTVSSKFQGVKAGLSAIFEKKSGASNCSLPSFIVPLQSKGSSCVDRSAKRMYSVQN